MLRLLIAGVVVFVALSLVLAVVAQKYDFFAERVVSEISKALSTAAGIELHIADVKGNPLIGFYGTGVELRKGSSQLLSAESIRIHLSLPSVLLGSPKLSQLALSRGRLDYEAIRALIDEKTKEEKDPAKKPLLPGDIPIKQLRLDAFSAQTPKGEFSAQRLTVNIDARGYRIRGRGAFANDPYQLDVTLLQDETSLALSKSRATFGKSQGKAEGMLSPHLHLVGSLAPLNLDQLVAFLPVLANVGFSGDLATSFVVRDDTREGLVASGDAELKSGSVWKVALKGAQGHWSYRDSDLAMRLEKASIRSAAVSGDIGVDWGSSESVLLRANLAGKNFQLAEWQEMLDFSLPEKLSGRAERFAATIEGPVKTLSGRVEANGIRVAYDKHTAENGRAVLRLNGKLPGDLALSCDYLDMPVTGRGKLVVNPPVWLKMDLDAGRFSVAQAQKLFPDLKEWSPEGSLSAKIHLEGFTSDIAVSGEARSERIHIKKGTLSEEFSNIFVAFTYEKDTIGISSASLNWRRASFKGAGSWSAFSEPEREKLDFAGEFAGLSLESFYDLAPELQKQQIRSTVAGKWALDGNRADPRVGFDLNFSNIANKWKIPLRNPRVEGTWRKSGQIDLASYQLAFGGGSVTGKGTVALPQEKRPLAYALEGQFVGLDSALLKSSGIASVDLKGGARGEFAVEDKGSGLAWKLAFDMPQLASGTLKVTKIAGKATGTLEKLHLDDLRADFFGGSVVLSGDLSYPKMDLKEAKLDLSGRVRSMDVATLLRRIAPSVHQVQGTLFSTFSFKGSLQQPHIALRGYMRHAVLYGFYFPRMMCLIEGTPKDMKINQLRANTGHGVLEASGSVYEEKGQWVGKINAKGSSIDLSVISTTLPKEVKGKVEGKVSLDFHGEGFLSESEGTGRFMGRGMMTFPELKVMGVRVTNLKTPLFVSDGFIMTEGSRGDLYGGVFEGRIAKDLKSSRWGGRFSVKSVDVNPLMKDLLPGMSGDLIAKGSLGFRIAGETDRTSMQDGGGQFSLTDGEIKGFAGMEMLQGITGGNPIRFNSVQGTFTVDGRTLYLLPGSRATAPKGDRVFRYVMVDGSVNHDAELNFNCLGNVNIRALNTFVGGLSGVLSGVGSDLSTGLDTTSLMTNFLGGAVSGIAKDEFRDVSFVMKGRPGNMKFSELHVASPPKRGTFVPPGTEEEKQRKSSKSSTEIKIRIDIPVGPKGEYEGDSEVKQQFLEQILKNAIEISLD